MGLRIRLSLAFAGLLVITGGSLYLAVPAVRWRVDYLPRYARTRWRSLRPHPAFVPTPAPVATAKPPAATPTPHLTAPLTSVALATPTPHPTPTPLPAATPTPPPALAPVRPAVQLTGFRHEWQGWNNCGPATLTMALSFYGRGETQHDAAPVLKPDPDDKNVGPEEMAAYARSLGLEATVRVGGDLATLKRLLSNGLPVVVETWFIPKPGDEMGHYRLLTGYSDAEERFITHDSYQGAGVLVGYGELDELWRVFNRVYLVVYRPEQAGTVAAIAGTDDEAMYRHALAVAQAEAEAHPDDAYAWFDVGTNHTALGHYTAAADAYDRARILGLPWRMLWYQFGPFRAYLGVGRYRDVLDLAAANLATSENLEESYYYRGRALEAMGQLDQARAAYRTALEYNPRFSPAADALRAVKSDLPPAGASQTSP